MDIRKLMNIIENIQNRESEDTDKDTTDIEKDVKKNTDTSMKDEKDDSEKDDSGVDDNEEDDNTEDDEEDKDPVEEFKSIGNSLGHGLYSIVPYNSIGQVWNGDALSEPNKAIVEKIDSVFHDGWFNNTNPIQRDDDIVSDRILPVVIDNEKNNQGFMFIANGVNKQVYYIPELESLIDDDTVSESQATILKKLQTVAEKWVNSVPDYVPHYHTRPGEKKSKEDRLWGSTESKLLSFIGNTSSVKEKDFWKDIKFISPDDPRSFEQWLLRKQKEKNNAESDIESDVGVGREKRDI